MLHAQTLILHFLEHHWTAIHTVMAAPNSSSCASVCSQLAIAGTKPLLFRTERTLIATTQVHKPLGWDGREGSPNSLSYFSVPARAVAKLTWLAGGAGCLSPSSDGAWLALSHGSSQSRDE